ncbi:MAG: hypothetical protein N3A57_07350 [Negativicutes bacterium]|nr:hypothetical protein [Negativicutes bacterium]
MLHIRNNLMLQHRDEAASEEKYGKFQKMVCARLKQQMPDYQEYRSRLKDIKLTQ